MSGAPNAGALASLSAEFALACDREGRITWADDRALGKLGCAPGTLLASLAVPGTEAKLRLLLERAAAGRVTGWESPLMVDGRPETVAFSGAASGETIALVGQVVPAHLLEAMAQASESMEEVVRLNRQVVGQRKELERRHQELLQLNQQLTEVHMGVLTMHSELEDRSAELRHTAEIKTRIVNNVSHEFRTPLHSILGLAELLQKGNDGPLNAEQAKQVQFIRHSASELMQLVDDLLDLSRSEAGQAALRMERFDLGEFLASQKGILRPIIPEGSPVRLEFEMPPRPVVLETDKAKLSQVLRNLVSNALKFTEVGEVRVRTHMEPDGGVAIDVVDSGIGIAPQDLERVFEEFGQVDGPLQARRKGTGLGLPLSRRLAQMLGGSLSVVSEPGRGSTFTITIPGEHAEVREMQQLVERNREKPPGSASILVVEDDRKTLFIYERYLVMAGFHVIPARTIDEARAATARSRPAAIVLDVMLEGEASWGFLGELKRDPGTRDIPVLVVTVTNRAQKARALGADEFWLKPVDQDKLLRRLKAVAGGIRRARVLVIDDDPKARYIVAKHLEGSPYELVEAADGHSGVLLARERVPDVILLDFLLPEMTAFDVLDELKSDPRTRAIPVIVVTSQALDVVQRRRLLEEAEAVISKQSLSRELAINRIRDALLKGGATLEGA